MDRNEAIARIRAALKVRSGKTWSVTGGRGTAWGWITIDAPPARRVWHFVPNPGACGATPEDYTKLLEMSDCYPGVGHMGPEDRKELARLLGLDKVHFQGETIAARDDYRREYVDRAEGRTPSVIGTQYWD